MTHDHELASFVDGRPHETRLDPAALGLVPKRIACELGYADGRLPDPVARAVDQALASARELLAPRALWLARPGDVDSESDSLVTPDVTLEVGKMVRGHLRGARAIAIFVVTIGPELESVARSRMRDGSLLDGFVLDAIGSSATEAAADLVESEIRETARSAGWRVTNRLSPGYCQWPTHEQRKLFGLLPDRPCGIELTRSSLMIPIKSVSGIVGLGPHVRYLDYMCSICDMATCYKRRKPPESPGGAGC